MGLVLIIIPQTTVSALRPVVQPARSSVVRMQYGQAGNLPAGWVSGIDQASGQPYYFNEQTGQSQWEAPAAQGYYGGAQGWTVCFNMECTMLSVGEQRTYGRYDMPCQGRTETSKRVSRQQFVISVGGDGAASLMSIGKPPTGWRSGPYDQWIWLSAGQSQPLTSGNQISMDKGDPESCVLDLQQGGGPANAVYGQQQNLLPGWRAVVDQTGQSYYYNDQTGQSQWEAPVAQGGSGQQPQQGYGQQPQQGYGRF